MQDVAAAVLKDMHTNPNRGTNTRRNENANTNTDENVDTLKLLFGRMPDTPLSHFTQAAAA